MFIRRSRICRGTEKSGALDNSKYDGDTFSVENKQKVCCFGGRFQQELQYVFISVFENIKSATEDKILRFVSNMGNNMIRYTIAVD